MKFLLPNNPLPSIGMMPGMPGTLGIPGLMDNPYIPNGLKGLKRAVNYYADYGGCGFWRMVWPEYMINIYQRGIVNGAMNMILEPRYYAGVASTRVQRQATPQQFNFLKHLKNISSHNGMKMLYDIDDVIFIEDIPPYNACRDAFDNKEIRDTSVQAMLLCDTVTVCSDYMRDYYAQKTGHPNVRTIKNYMPKFWYDRFYTPEGVEERYFAYRRKPRVGVLSSATHVDVKGINANVDDFTHVSKEMIKTCKDIQWVIMGSQPRALVPYIKKGLMEHHPWANLNDYPAAVHKLKLNMTFAPLIDNEFNRAKSDIKIAEAGALGIPCIVQDVVTYKDGFVKFTTGDELIEKIVKLTKNEQYYFDVSKKSRAFAEARWLDDHIDEYLDLYCLK